MSVDMYLAFFFALWKLIHRKRRELLFLLFLVVYDGLGDDANVGLPRELNVESDISAEEVCDGSGDLMESGAMELCILFIIPLEFIDE